MKITKNQSRNALNWFLKFIKQNAAKLPTTSKHNVRAYSKSTEYTFIGDVFLFCDKRFKDAKDYPDLFPLVIPVRVYGDGFYAINLHKVEPSLRLRLIKKLSSFKTKYTDQLYSAISFKFLRGVAGTKEFENSLQYFPAAVVRSDFIRVPQHEWLKSVSLPIHVVNQEK